MIRKMLLWRMLALTLIAGGPAAADSPAGKLGLIKAQQAQTTAVLAQTKAQMPPDTMYPRFIHFDDSEGQGRNGDDRTNTFGDNTMTSMVAIASAGVLFPVKVSSVGGQPSTTMSARVIRDIYKYRPQVLAIGGGVNDIVVLNSADLFEANLNREIDVGQSIGAFIVLINIPPASTGNGDPALVNSINAIYARVAAQRGLPLVDRYGISNDPANPGHYKANRTFDGRHPISAESWLWAQAEWAAIKALLPPRKPLNPLQDAGNLLFTPITTAGVPANTSTRDPLFLNYTSLTQGGFTITQLPRLFGALFGTNGGQSVAGAVNYDPATGGNAFVLTYIPGASAGTFNAQTVGGFRAIDFTRYQGRRIRWTFWMKTEGFGVDNTPAYLAANNNDGIITTQTTLVARNSGGGTIAALNVADPIDSSASLGQASTISLDTQALPFKGQNFDFTWRQFSMEMSVPVGAIEGIVTLNVTSKAGAVSTVKVGLANMSIIDVGPADPTRAALPISNPEIGFLDVKASTTLTVAQMLSIGLYRCDATSGPVVITLPTAVSGVAGRSALFKKVDSSANPCTITAAGVETIDGSNTKALTAQFSTAQLRSNGTSWDILAVIADLPPWWQNGRINPAYRAREVVAG